MPWTKIYICLKNGVRLPVIINPTTFMSILTCFHNKDQNVSKLTTIYIIDEINPQFSIRSKILLKLYYKLDHLDFYLVVQEIQNF